MGKNKNEKNNGAKGEKVIDKIIVMDESKKKVAGEVLNALIRNILVSNKITKEQMDVIVKEQKVPEKTLKAFCGKMEKFYISIMKGKKEKKAKDVGIEMEKKIQEATILTANNLATNLFKTTATFVKLIVLKKSKKENANCNGKSIFKMANNQKEYFLCWDYRNEDLFVGSTLHEYTEEIKKEKKEKEGKK